MLKSKTHKTVYSAINPKLFKRFETVRGDITRSTFLRLALEAYLAGVENGSITPKVPAQRNSNPERFEPKQPKIDFEKVHQFESKPAPYSDMNGEANIELKTEDDIADMIDLIKAGKVALNVLRRLAAGK